MPDAVKLIKDNNDLRTVISENAIKTAKLFDEYAMVESLIHGLNGNYQNFHTR